MESGYMEAFGDWFLTYRDAEELIKTLKKVNLQDVECDNFLDETGRIVFVRAKKVI